MSSITQTIPNYTGGISEQPDQLKVPGQVKSVQNAIPDVVYGLYKRPGAKRLGTAPLTNVQAGGSWFHYHRDETEGSYIGQVAADGKVRIWSCNDGTEKTVHYDTAGQAYNASDSDHTSITSYLKTEFEGDYTRALKVVTVTADTNHGLSTGDKVRMYFTGAATDGEYTITVTGNTTFTLEDTVSGTISSTACTFVKPKGTEDIQALTINDTTFLNNRSKIVTTTGTTDARPHKNFAYIELLRTENGRQYAFNIYDDSTTQTINVATRIKVVSDELGEGQSSGQCKGIGTKVYSGAETNTGSKKNLTFRLTVLGQQGIRDGAGGPIEAEEYACSYSRELTLLHGGEGWTSASGSNQLTVVGPSANGKLSAGDGNTGSNSQYRDPANFVIEVTEHEAVSVRANIKAVRPAPTPFDADTAVTVDSILGGMTGELSGVTVNGNALNYTVIGNGIYLYTTNDADDFNVEIVDKDLMRVMQTEINDVTSLPVQCKHNMIVKISNTRQSDEDDYYVRFNGENQKDGPGSWIECAQPGIVKSLVDTSLPHVLQRQADGTFLVKKYTWEDRDVGDNVTNTIPSFVGGTINKVLFFRNRLVFLSGEHVVCSRAGTIASPNFWSNTALTVSVIDPIDISCSSNYPSDLYDAIEITAGLLCFSSNAQFLLSSDDTIFNPDTAKLRAVAWYNYDVTTPPLSLGQTVGFIDNSNKYSRFMEMANVSRESEPAVINTSKIVPSLLPKNSDLFTNSRENNIVLFGKTDSDEVIGFRYLNIGDKRQQSSWFKWKFNNALKYHFIVNDQYFLLDKDNFLQSVNLVQADADPALDQDSVNYLIHLDNYTTISGGVFDSVTNKTTFTHGTGGCVFNWESSVTKPNPVVNKLVVIDTNDNATRIGRYAECTITSSGSTFTVPGDWSSATLEIGYLYDYQVDFPRFYLQKTQGEVVQSDINSKLTIHRMKLNFGKIGLYETTLNRVGKSAYTEVYESTDLDEYDASDAPYLSEKIKDIPVYERNTNVDVTLKSSHPAPATLRSMSWEGDWSPMHYRRV